MATAKKTEEIADYSKMNVYRKLQLARLKFSTSNVEKSGIHPKLEYKYFELQDIVPTATAIFNEIGLLMVTEIRAIDAHAVVYNADNPAEFIDFVVPYTPVAPIISNSGNAVTNPMQATGSSITYIRRYLWQVVLDVVESDSIDNGEYETKSTAVSTPKPKTPVAPAQREEIKKNLTATPENPASAESVKELKSALKKLLDTDNDQESFVQELALKTEGFTHITQAQCDELIEGVNEMLKGYEEVK